MKGVLLFFIIRLCDITRILWLMVNVIGIISIHTAVSAGNEDRGMDRGDPISRILNSLVTIRALQIYL